MNFPDTDPRHTVKPHFSSLSTNRALPMAFSHSFVFTATILILILGVSSGTADKVNTLPNQPSVGFNQYAGYVTVDTNHQRKLFYYFVEAEVHPASKPLVLWLNGGPGCSSVGQGAFSEHGPFKPTKKGGLVKNKFSWNKEANMLYLDSPAGVGFSYSANTSDYYMVTDEMTAIDNLAFLQHWFAKFPTFRNNDFFITGESYAGHYAPQLAELILRTKTKFNLKGIAIGNPLLEFNTDFNARGEFLWAHGLIPDSTYEMLTKACNYSQLRREYQSGKPSSICVEVNWLLSKEVSRFIDSFDVIVDVCLSSDKQQAYRLTQMQVEQKMDICQEDETFTYLNRREVQKALHSELVGIKYWSTCSPVLAYDWKNLEIPTISLLGTLVKSDVRVMVYSGDQDSVIPFLGSRSLVNRLAKDLGLNTTESYRAWFKGKQVAGWTQVYGDYLSFATVRGAAHAAPSSQPGRSLVLFKSFLEGKSLPNIL
ncbi:serine carboxypeptidase [Trifolium repens]|nr:serine carboxypeptidase [Trifolium repens]